MYEKEMVNKEYYGLTMGALGSFCLLGHGLIALAIRSKPSLKERTFFLRSLGLSDIFVTIHIFMSAWAAFQKTWVFGKIGCQLDAYIGMAFALASISNAAWIAKDKYYYACESRKWGQNYSKCAMILWLSAIGFAALPFLGVGSYGFETSDPFWQTGCMLDFHHVGVKYTLYIIILSLVWFALPLYHIIWYYKKIRDAEKAKLPMEYIVPAQMIASWLPYAAYAMLSITLGTSVVPFYVTAINNVAAKIFFATNPFLYMWSDDELGKACIEVITGKKGIKEASE
ncbi:unnamed protein product [Clavelina lepadiformis]|uniref:G-protein coupled receptors family 1 profile domain-containing protein n=1 Tax=Clavelina lepadiformis TaxID=159417 RepID=A0ABP0GW76_CLALP